MTTYKELQKLNSQTFATLHKDTQRNLKIDGYKNVGKKNVYKSFILLMQTLDIPRWTRLNELVGQYKSAKSSLRSQIRTEIFDTIGLGKSHNLGIFNTLKDMVHTEYAVMVGGQVMEFGTLELVDDLRNAQTFGTFDSCLQFVCEFCSDITKGLEIVKLDWCPNQGWQLH